MPEQHVHVHVHIEGNAQAERLTEAVERIADVIPQLGALAAIATAVENIAELNDSAVAERLRGLTGRLNEQQTGLQESVDANRPTTP